MAQGLTKKEIQERIALLIERDKLEKRHTEVVLRLAALEFKRLGQAYKFQNSHEHT